MRSRVSRGLILFAAAGLLAAVFRDGQEIPADAAGTGGYRPARRERTVEQPDPLRLLRQAALDPEKREELLERAVDLLLKRDPPAGLAFIARSSPPQLREELETRLLHDWAERAPEQALAAVLEMDGEPSSRLLAIVHETWASHDLEAAVASLDDLPAGEAAEQAAIGIAGEAIRTDPGQALELVAPLPPSPERDEVLERAVREWALTDPQGAIAHAKSFIEAPLRERLLAAALVEWSETDPFAAASSAATELREGRIQDNAIVSISQRWAQTAPAEADAWIESLPKSDLQDDARTSRAVSK